VIPSSSLAVEMWENREMDMVWEWEWELVLVLSVLERVWNKTFSK
jgi:hypothetical protein